MTLLKILTLAAVGSLAIATAALAQAPQPVLRFDEALREELDDLPDHHKPLETDTMSRIACKLNRRRVDFAEAYGAVTLWNIRRVKVRQRRMSLTDTTCREEVRMLKFFVERNRRKGVRPHLLGNVSGYRWTVERFDTVSRRHISTEPFIHAYTLRDGAGPAAKFVPDALWHTLTPDATYRLNGVEVPGGVFQFIDGLILRTLNIYGDVAGHPHGLVDGDTYPSRLPLVFFNGTQSSLASWLSMCHAGAFSVDAALPLYYFYMPPAEAVSLYGERGKFGAICISVID